MKGVAANIFMRILKGFFITAFLFLFFEARVCKGNSAIIFQSAKRISRTEVYAALSRQDTVAIDKVLESLGDDTSASTMAYTGVLLMRKSALKKFPIEKLNLFKEGRMRLQEAFNKDSSNSEFRFLRLIIQENCPRFLNYYENINKDAEAIKLNYKDFPQELKKAVTDYSKTSKALKPEDLSY